VYVPEQLKCSVALEVAYKLLPCLMLISNMLVILMETNMYTQSVARWDRISRGSLDVLVA
jgi:hypothetical protein